MKTAVIVCVDSYRDWLPWYLESIRHWSPGTPVHLLYDLFKFKPEYHDVIPVPLAGLYDDPLWVQFKSRYVLRSVNPLYFELGCWMRHFMCLAYARKMGLSNYWYFDWDTLIFCDLQAESERRSAFKLSKAGGCFLVNDLDFMEGFLKWSVIHRWINHPPHYVTSNSDQDLERMYFDDPCRTNHVWRLDDPVDGDCFCDNLATPTGNAFSFDTETKMVKLDWRPGPLGRQPFALQPSTERSIQLKGIHFWIHKPKMEAVWKNSLV